MYGMCSDIEKWQPNRILKLLLAGYYNLSFTNFRCDFESVGGRALIERMKFNILEIQENFENFLDKKEMTFEVSTIKVSID